MKRLCVSRCPKEGDYMLSCLPTKLLSCKKNNNPHFEVSIYDSDVETPRIGSQCIPSDPILRNKLNIQSGSVGNAGKYRSILNGLKISAIFAIILGAIFFLIIQCFPLLISRTVILLGAIGLLILSLLILFTRVDLFRVISGFKIFVIVILILIAIMLLYTVFTQPL
jgi:hypothetical protein